MHGRKMKSIQRMKSVCVSLYNLHYNVVIFCVSFSAKDGILLHVHGVFYVYTVGETAQHYVGGDVLNQWQRRISTPSPT